MFLSHYYIRKEIGRLKKNALKRSRNFCSLQKAGRLLVFCLYSDWNDIKEYVSQLRSGNKEVILCVYSGNEEAPEDFTDKDVFISKKDLNWFGFPKTDKLDKCMAVESDIVIDLTCGRVPSLSYMVLKHNAPFKVGIKNNNMDFYDLTISMSDAANVDYLFSQIIFYLQTISFK